MPSLDEFVALVAEMRAASPEQPTIEDGKGGVPPNCYLGSVCKREHRYQGSNTSLRRSSTRACVDCERERLSCRKGKQNPETQRRYRERHREKLKEKAKLRDKDSVCQARRKYEEKRKARMASDPKYRELRKKQKNKNDKHRYNSDPDYHRDFRSKANARARRRYIEDPEFRRSRRDRSRKRHANDPERNRVRCREWQARLREDDVAWSAYLRRKREERFFSRLRNMKARLQAHADRTATPGDSASGHRPS